MTAQCASFRLAWSWSFVRTSFADAPMQSVQQLLMFSWASIQTITILLKVCLSQEPFIVGFFCSFFCAGGWDLYHAHNRHFPSLSWIHNNAVCKYLEVLEEWVPYASSKTNEEKLCQNMPHQCLWRTQERIHMSKRNEEDMLNVFSLPCRLDFGKNISWHLGQKMFTVVVLAISAWPTGKTGWPWQNTLGHRPKSTLEYLTYCIGMQINDLIDWHLGYHLLHSFAC